MVSPTRLTTPDPTGSYTYADRRHWPAAQRGELLAGQWLPPVPELSPAHQACVQRLAEEIQWLLTSQPERLGRGPLDVRLPRTATTPDAAITTVLRPDLFVVPDAAGFDAQGYRGIPDWVLEVTSPYFTERDTRLKRALCEAHGVREYWVALPEQRTVLVYVLEQGHYRLTAGHFGPGPMPVTVLPGLAVEWAEVFDEA